MPKCWYDGVDEECNPFTCQVVECGVRQGYVTLDEKIPAYENTKNVPADDSDSPCFMNPDLPRDCMECHDVACPYH